MTATQFTAADVKTVKRWSDRVFYDFTSDDSLLGQMISDGTLIKKEDLSKGAGDSVKYHFLNRLTEAGLMGDESATGNEAALTYAQDSLNINLLRMPVQIPNDGTISAQRVTFDLPEDSYQNLRDWMIDRSVRGAINQLAGFTATSFTYDGVSYSGNARQKLLGMNDAVAPTSTRIIRAGSANTTDQAVNADTTATFTFKLIDSAEKLAENARPYIRPLSMSNGIKYKCYVHIDQYYQLVQDESAPIKFRDLLYNQLAGGKKEALIGRSIDYGQTRIIATDKIPNGVHSSTAAVQTNTRRAVFVGKEAGCVAFGKGFTAGGSTTPGFSFKQDTTDIEHWKRISINNIFGIKKTQFDSIDHGSIVITTYAA